MNMGLNKSVYVLTLVIFVIIFNDHKSYANYCDEQIIQYGQMDNNFNATQAFTHAYRKLTEEYVKSTKKYILENYFGNHLFQVLEVNTNIHWARSPSEWIKKKYPNSTVTSFCDEIQSYSSAKFKAYNEKTESDFQDEENKGYYEYILKKLLRLVPDLNIYRPSEFCERYTVEECEWKILKTNAINYDGDSRAAFKVIYRSLQPSYYGYEEDILCQYIQDLFDAVVPDNVDQHIDDPLKWCIAKQSEDEEYDIKVAKCQLLLLRSEFYFRVYTTKKALTKAYFELTESEMTRDNLKGYYEYMLQEILSFDFGNAENPRKFCEKHFEPENYDD